MRSDRLESLELRQEVVNHIWMLAGEVLEPTGIRIESVQPSPLFFGGEGEVPLPSRQAAMVGHRGKGLLEPQVRVAWTVDQGDETGAFELCRAFQARQLDDGRSQIDMPSKSGFPTGLDG